MQNHSCDPNLAVYFARLGSNKLNPPVPLIFTQRYIRAGEFLTLPYWYVNELNEVSKFLAILPKRDIDPT